MERLLLDLSINVTAMFRDPTFFFAFREKVVPALRTYPFARLWVAGCSTGEEVYSLAILLAEEGLADRVADLRDRHQRSGDRDCAARRLPAGQDAGVHPELHPGRRRPLVLGVLRRALRQRAVRRQLVDGVVFARHNLASDAAFNEFNVITCRNVMIYFAQPLQEHVHRLFYESLATFGVLALGQKETIRFSPHESAYEELDAEERLYKKVR